jgi:hypothetical protein
MHLRPMTSDRLALDRLNRLPDGRNAPLDGPETGMGGLAGLRQPLAAAHCLEAPRI